MLSVCLSVYLSVCAFVCLSACLSVHDTSCRWLIDLTAAGLLIVGFVEVNVSVSVIEH